MISAAYYQYVYLLVVTLMTFYAMSLYNNWGKQYSTRNSSQFVAFILLFFVVWFIGTRPVSGKYFVDMANYSLFYDMGLGEPFSFNRKTENILWDNFFNWMASKRIDFTTWAIVVAAAYFGWMYWACKKLFGKDILLAFVVYLAAFSTFSYGTNGMKAGVAASLFLVAIAYIDNLRISIPIALLSYGFHHSMIMVIAAYFVVLFVKNIKYYFLGWIASIIIAAFHITFFQSFFAGFASDHSADYLLATEDTGYYVTGFRPDFILYSAVPICLAYLVFVKNKYQSNIYLFMLRLYILTNAIWMLCMYADFANRIAYLSWFMYPFVLLYPFVSHDKIQLQGKYLQYVVYGHLAFTLFMMFIYYR